MMLNMMSDTYSKTCLMVKGSPYGAKYNRLCVCYKGVDPTGQIAQFTIRDVYQSNLKIVVKMHHINKNAL